MAQVYVIYSPSIDSYYIGSCSDFDERLKQHLNGEYTLAFTKKAADWQEYILFDNLSYSQARQMEVHIKKMKSRKYLVNLKQYEEMRLKLLEKFGADSSR
ncbi:GIY-YIG nuclease family protein [Salinimicrobium soli]|uniref:GIY-YIG nuclease family protein n=1 Tax=Salinimicrobium soli TaxID=1254399 RepID=UPI003AAA7847